MHKNHNVDDLTERLELEEKKQNAKAELLEHNPLFHAATPPPPSADNENQPVASVFKVEEKSSTLTGTASECISAGENPQQFQDIFGDLIATQLRFGQLWLESWLNLFSPAMLNTGLSLNSADKKNGEAIQASALVMGA